MDGLCLPCHRRPQQLGSPWRQAKAAYRRLLLWKEISVTPVLDKESGKGLNKPMWLQMIRMRGMVPLCGVCGVSAVPPDKVALGHSGQADGQR